MQRSGFPLLLRQPWPASGYVTYPADFWRPATASRSGSIMDHVGSAGGYAFEVHWGEYDRPSSGCGRGRRIGHRACRCRAQSHGGAIESSIVGECAGIRRRGRNRAGRLFHRWHHHRLSGAGGQRRYRDAPHFHGGAGCRNPGWWASWPALWNQPKWLLFLHFRLFLTPAITGSSASL